MISYFGHIRWHFQVLFVGFAKNKVLFVGVKGALSWGLKMHGIIRAIDRAPNSQIIIEYITVIVGLNVVILFTEDASHEN